MKKWQNLHTARENFEEVFSGGGRKGGGAPLAEKNLGFW